MQWKMTKIICSLKLAVCECPPNLAFFFLSFLYVHCEVYLKSLMNENVVGFITTCYLC